MEATAKKFLKASVTSFHTASFVGFKELKSLFCLKDNFLFIDFSEETTEVVLNRDGYLEEAASFAKGGYYFIRQLAVALNIPPEEAVSLFGQYEENHLSPEEKRKIDDILKEAREKWLFLFDRALEGMSGAFFMPQRIFFLGGAGFFSGFLSFVGDSFGTGTKKLARLGEFSVIKQISQPALASHFIALPGSAFPQKNLTLIFALFINKEKKM